MVNTFSTKYSNAMKRLPFVRVSALVFAAVFASELAGAQPEDVVLRASMDRKRTIEFAIPDGEIRHSFLPEFSILYRPDDPGLGQNCPVK